MISVEKLQQVRPTFASQLITTSISQPMPLLRIDIMDESNIYRQMLKDRLRILEAKLNDLESRTHLIHLKKHQENELIVKSNQSLLKTIVQADLFSEHVVKRPELISTSRKKIILTPSLDHIISSSEKPQQEYADLKTLSILIYKDNYHSAKASADKGGPGMCFFF